MNWDHTSDGGIKFNPSPVREFLEESVLLIILIFSILYGSFVPEAYDVFGGTFLIIFFVGSTALLIIPTILTNHIIVKGDEFSFSHAYSPWITHTVKIADIARINFLVNKGKPYLTFKLESGKEINKHIKSWDDEMISHFFSLLLKIKPGIKLPEKYAELATNFESREIYEQKRAKYKRRETLRGILGWIFFVAIAVGLAYLNYKSPTSEPVPFFGDSLNTFFKSLNL